MGDPVPSTSSTSKKRKKENAPNEDDPSPKRPPLESSSKAENVVSSAGLKNSLHGNVFQLKLLYLFLMRGLEAGYDFQLATERPDLGDKFDDLVFKFWPDKSNQSEFKIRFVQAKHKQSNKETITAANLLNTTDDDFSLVKYFRSFRHICKENSKNLLDVVICCNAGFDINSLLSNGFSLTSYQHSDEEKLFTSDTTLHNLNLDKTNVHVQELLANLKQCSVTHLLADEIIKCFQNKTTLTLKNSWFRLYHFALVEERVLKVINPKGKKEFRRNSRKKNPKEKKEFLVEFHDDFKEKRNLSLEATALYDVLCKEAMWEKLKVFKFKPSSTFGRKSNKNPDVLINLPSDFVKDSEIDEFFKKLVFAKVPSEVELGKILANSIGKLDGLNNSCLQSAFVLEKILNWFKTKESKFMTAKEGLDILKEKEEKIKALQYTYNSLHYQEIVMEDKFSFRPEAIQPMAKRLETFLSDEDSQVLHIFTLSCELSCIKLHFALQRLGGFEQKDSYWMLPYSDLKKTENFTLLKEMMKSRDSPNILIVVCNDMLPHFKASDAAVQKQQKVILIRSEVFPEGILEEKVMVERDEIIFTDLSEESQARLLNVSVNFQGEKNLKVKTLIQSDEPFKIIDSLSVLQLYLNRVNGIDVGVAPPVSSHYDEHLYIDRRLVSPFPLEEFENRLRETPEFGEMFELSAEGNIEWKTGNYSEQSACWKEIKKSIVGEENHPSQKYTITESELLTKWKNSKVVIVSDIPGIGKSALLTHLYEQIKKASCYNWVIRINLIDYADLFDVKVNIDNVTDTLDFLINRLMESSWNSSHFAKTLFRYRLLKSGEVVLMLDGFDEMQDHCQMNAVLWMKALLTQTKVDRIYVTTRPHMKEELENQFFQFSFLIEDFSEVDQKLYLTNFWMKKLKIQDERIQQFAESLVELAKKNLNDGERIFSGVPLHCRMLAECFLDYLEKEMLATVQYVNVPTYLEGSFHRVSLFRLYWKTKCKILQEEKRKIDSNNVFNSVAEQAESIIPRQFFQKLAIDSLFDENNANVFWDKSQLKSILQQYSDLSFVHGLTEKNGAKQRFPHLMSAEYFVADYVICTFQDEERSRSFDKLSIQDLILKKILYEKQFKGVRLFLDGLLRSTIPGDCVSWPFASKKELSFLLSHEMFNNRLLLSEKKDFFINDVIFGVTKEGHAYILGWLLYCAKEAFTRNSKEGIRWNDEMLIFLDPSKVCSILQNNIDNIECIFKRLLLWFEGANKSVLIDIINGIFTGLSKFDFSFRWYRLSRGSEIKTFLNFIERHREELGTSYLSNLSSEQDETFILTDLLWSYGTLPDLIEVEICEFVLIGLRNIFVGNPATMMQILERWFRCAFKTRVTRGKRPTSITDNSWTTPSVFEHFPCLVIMIGLKHLNAILKLESAEVREHFDSITRPIFMRALTLDPLILTQLEPDTYNAKVSLNVIEERDIYGLTLLQRAAICGDVEGIENILKIGNKELLCRELIEGENRLTPLYLAVSCCKQKACLVILEFLKFTFSSEKFVEDLLSSRGCLYRAILDAQDRRSIDTERVIAGFLNVFVITFGKKLLLEFLMNGRVLMDRTLSVSILKLAVVRDMYDVISKVVEIYSREKSLSDLVFNEDKCIVITALARKSNVDLLMVLKKMLENILYWKKEKLLLEFLFMINNSYARNINFIVNMFCCSVVQEFMVEKLFPTAFPYFLQLLTSKRAHDSGFSSVWTEYCTQPGTSVKFIEDIFDYILLDRERVIEITFHNDGEGPVIALAKKRERDDVVEIMRCYITKINRLDTLQEIDAIIADVIPEKNTRHKWIPRRPLYIN